VVCCGVCCTLDAAQACFCWWSQCSFKWHCTVHWPALFVCCGRNSRRLVSLSLFALTWPQVSLSPAELSCWAELVVVVLVARLVEVAEPRELRDHCDDTLSTPADQRRPLNWPDFGSPPRLPAGPLLAGGLGLGLLTFMASDSEELDEPNLLAVRCNCCICCICCIWQLGKAALLKEPVVCMALF